MKVHYPFADSRRVEALLPHGTIVTVTGVSHNFNYVVPSNHIVRHNDDQEDGRSEHEHMIHRDYLKADTYVETTRSAKTLA